MALRVAFFPVSTTSTNFYKEELVEFKWVSGMAKSQRQKCLLNFHSEIALRFGELKILEISSISTVPLGIKLSAFNLEDSWREIKSTVECFYQGAKVFSEGGPYTDLFHNTSLNAKQDRRLTESGDLIYFEFLGDKWSLQESPNFYDYLYVHALSSNVELANGLMQYDVFTDFAYSQNNLTKKAGKSFNCQARSAAIYVSLNQSGLLQDYLADPQAFAASKEFPGVDQLEIF